MTFYDWVVVFAGALDIVAIILLAALFFWMSRRIK